MNSRRRSAAEPPDAISIFAAHSRGAATQRRNTSRHGCLAATRRMSTPLLRGLRPLHPRLFTGRRSAAAEDACLLRVYSADHGLHRWRSPRTGVIIRRLDISVLKFGTLHDFAQTDGEDDFSCRAMQRSSNEPSYISSVTSHRRPFARLASHKGAAHYISAAGGAAGHERPVSEHLVDGRSAYRRRHPPLDAPRASARQPDPHRRQDLSADGQRAEGCAGAAAGRRCSPRRRARSTTSTTATCTSRSPS